MSAVPHSAFEDRVYMGAVSLESLHDEIRRGKDFVDFSNKYHMLSRRSLICEAKNLFPFD